jgi:ArsR family transcriptional regulator
MASMKTQLLNILKALANEARLQILEDLSDVDANYPERLTRSVELEHGVCIGLIQKKSGLSQSTISSYMAQLERTGLVRVKRVGKQTYYRRDNDSIKKFYQLLKEVL